MRRRLVERNASALEYDECYYDGAVGFAAAEELADDIEVATAQVPLGWCHLIHCRYCSLPLFSSPSDSLFLSHPPISL